jgi:curved DNA-binding protein CbpA
LNNHYEILGIKQGASEADIKKAFREKAKMLHPDIAGTAQAEAMRRLINAYEVLSSREHRFNYDRAYTRFAKKSSFNYRTWLNEQENPVSQAKLIFLELLHFEEDRAIAIWLKSGGLDFCLQKYMEREDWMDCQYILAEELDKRGYTFESFKLMTAVLAEERRRPYFKIFTEEIENYLKNMVKFRLKFHVDEETWLDCLAVMLKLGFSAQDEKRFKQSMVSTLENLRA